MGTKGSFLPGRVNIAAYIWVLWLRLCGAVPLLPHSSVPRLLYLYVCCSVYTPYVLHWDCTTWNFHGFTGCGNYCHVLFNILNRTNYLLQQHVWPSKNAYSAHTAFMCIYVSFIWEQTATSAPYNINWLVFITKMKSVYCMVRTGSLNRAVGMSSLKGQSHLP
jgi:hypothetical protein